MAGREPVLRWLGCIAKLWFGMASELAAFSKSWFLRACQTRICFFGTCKMGRAVSPWFHSPICHILDIQQQIQKSPTQDGKSFSVKLLSRASFADLSLSWIGVNWDWELHVQWGKQFLLCVHEQHSSALPVHYLLVWNKATPTCSLNHRVPGP